MQGFCKAQSSTICTKQLLQYTIIWKTKQYLTVRNHSMQMTPCSLTESGKPKQIVVFFHHNNWLGCKPPEFTTISHPHSLRLSLTLVRLWSKDLIRMHPNAVVLSLAHTSPSSMRASCLSSNSILWLWARTTARKAFISANNSFNRSSWKKRGEKEHVRNGFDREKQW